MADATTTLNPGTGGDVLDETTAVQSDGATSAKRPRVEMALADAGLTPRLVGDDHQLPIEASATDKILFAILRELREIKMLLLAD